MITRTVTILLAIIGVGVGVYAVSTADREDPPPPPARTPPTSPFPSSVAAAGLVEAASKNIRVSAPFAALVTEVLVDVNDHVEAGQPLLKLDARELEAGRASAVAAIAAAKAELERLQNQPRAEEVEVVRAADADADAQLQEAKADFDRMKNAEASGAATTSELDTALWRLRAAEARRQRAGADLTLKLAGAWSWDIEVARANVAVAEAALASLNDRIDRYTIRAPISGTVLKRDIEPGEYVSTDVRSPAIMLGDLSKLRIRARVDEADLPDFVSGAPAIARPRGRGDQAIQLSFVRLEPFAIVKTDLTGLALERVDTRVIEVLYDVVPPVPVPLVPGQLVDVYIDASHKVAKE